MPCWQPPQFGVPCRWQGDATRGALVERSQGETLIFVDVDGVLNVGVRVKGEAPINLSDSNYERALSLEGEQNYHADLVLAAARHELCHGEGSTYAKFISKTPSDVSEVLVGRLVELLRVAGPGCTAVLSSSWRKPQHRKMLRRLEERISAHLGASFAFREFTMQRKESGPEDRLETIGQYLATLGRKRQRSLGSLRVLVLEDFCISPLRDIRCCDCDVPKGRAPVNVSRANVPVDSVADAERFLEARAAFVAWDVRVKVIHTYDAFVSPEGLFMEVGCGLTMEHHCAALSFLGSRCEHCALKAPEDAQVQDGQASADKTGGGYLFGLEALQNMNTIMVKTESLEEPVTVSQEALQNMNTIMVKMERLEEPVTVSQEALQNMNTIMVKTERLEEPVTAGQEALAPR
uniref:Uncharacterized protein n=1 Tax=Alexandrium monilatum TaxID=311494 RepID=A0A7S4UF76_9DINO